ncbi:hypothetical protein EYZ11_008303 [Aspergillus tanneri]|uniref:DUF4604 domain-containing protein n=1 Tax=Aspergillus tanneri TaxID=1220188 RepID=A0A4S3JB59_9EURO|nr:uncharacterized protein ATNIH1004_001617 [Aspergillus tanneri]KAA8652712.1 hypothetical protein ATNIH1004_001617 [Aspergillus tanneri]THC92242.1 hypothetical protein EYZ11_008303 [Aspergillus tanneri]
MSYSAKNLTYEAKEPAFLQRLKGQYGNTPGRLQQPISRPRRPKVDSGDDDEPTYVDEASNEVISKEEYEVLVRGSAQEEDGSAEEKTEEPQTTQDKKDPQPRIEKEHAPKQNLAEIGGPKKRKQGKAIGENIPEADSEGPQHKVSGSRKAKQKKKIKLSFDET